MATTGVLPDVGTAVPMPADINLEAIDNLSVGQLAYLTLVAQSKFAERMLGPATANEFAQYRRASGADWSGHDVPPPEVGDASETDTAKKLVDQQHESGNVDPTNEHGAPLITPRPTPTPPECKYDAIPFIAEMLRRIQHTQDATITGFARQLQPVFFEQPEYLGTPEGVTAFNDSSAYFKEVLRFSWQTTKKIHDRMPYVTWNPGQDPSMGMNQPKLPELAEAFKEGQIPAENLDRIVALDQDLTRYVRKVGKEPDYKDAILREFESTLVEAAEASTPDAFSAARRRWAEKIAHHIDQDGPPLTEALRKRADNAIKTQDYSDGSGRISMHATPEIYAEFKNFAVNQLNKNGAPLKIDDALAEFLSVPGDDEQQTEHENLSDNKTSEHSSDTDNDSDTEAKRELFDEESVMPQSGVTLDDLTIDRDPKATVAEDENGEPVTQSQIDAIATLTPGQLLGTLLIGIFKTVLTMDPDELKLKKSHGAASTLTIIQDIETAYTTLGVGAIPEEARRPRGPDGVIPTVLKRPNPDRPDTAICNNPDHLVGSSPPPWTGYFSEALNIGALHRKDAAPLACDSQLVGQIWDNQHSVLNQRHAVRIFTPAQRRAILARDRGCQAPGCTIIAAYCQIHHLNPWELGGPTDVDNAISLCAAHHGAIHNGKWTIRTIQGVHFFQPAAWLDPAQPLLRNMYWAL